MSDHYEVKELRQKALIYEGSKSSNPNKRNYFLTSALELNDDFESPSLLNIDDSILNQISIDTLFSVISVRFNPENHDKSLYKACFNFNLWFLILSRASFEGEWTLHLSAFINPVF